MGFKALFFFVRVESLMQVILVFLHFAYVYRLVVVRVFGFIFDLGVLMRRVRRSVCLLKELHCKEIPLSKPIHCAVSFSTFNLLILLLKVLDLLFDLAEEHLSPVKSIGLSIYLIDNIGCQSVQVFSRIVHCTVSWNYRDSQIGIVPLLLSFLIIIGLQWLGCDEL